MAYKLHDTILSLVDEKNGFDVKFTKYEFTNAMRIHIAENIGCGAHNIPKKIIIPMNLTSAEAVYKHMAGLGIYLNDEYKEKIGSITKKGEKFIDVSETEFTIKFLSDVTWERGTFGASHNGKNSLNEAESCFFTSKAGAIKMILNNGGIPVVIYNGNAPFARFFILPVDKDAMVTFNMYANNHAVFGMPIEGVLQLFTEAIASNLDKELRVRQVIYYNNGSYSGKLHINNNGTGFLIKKGSFPSKINTEFPEEDFYHCVNCEKVIRNETDVIKDGTDNIWCEECADYKLDVCSYDNRLYKKNTMVTGPDGKQYFNKNIKKVDRFVFDQEHNKYIYRIEGIEVSKGVWVSIGSKMRACKSCGNLVACNDKGYCQTCAKDVSFTEIFQKHGVNPFDMTFDMDTDIDNLEALVLDLKVELGIR